MLRRAEVTIQIEYDVEKLTEHVKKLRLKSPLGDGDPFWEPSDERELLEFLFVHNNEECLPTDMEGYDRGIGPVGPTTIESRQISEFDVR